MTRGEALNLAIKALEQMRDKYSVKNNACLAHGDNPPWAYVKGRQKYKEYTRAIAVVEGLK